jgi:hypothetical protein
MKMDDNKECMERLVELLQTPQNDGDLKNEEVMVLFNSADDGNGA